MATIKGDDGTPSGFTPSNPFGVWGDSGSTGLGPGGNGVVGSSAASSGVAGFTLNNIDRAAGVFGMGPQVGVAGQVVGANTSPGRRRVGVFGTGSNGRNLGGVGVIGHSDTDVGVIGDSNTGPGVLGQSSGDGVVGFGFNNAGVFGISNEIGILGLGGINAGFFFGNVRITGTLSKGGGGFEIDHPIDPANRYLRHSFVESPDMKNLYDGIAVCDDRGEAVVELPLWFEKLNRDFRYQLTPIGSPAPNLFVAHEIKGHRFTIGGGSRGLKVSWQVTGTRHDAWANANRVVADDEKPAAERGRYLHPELHGYAREQGIDHEHRIRAEKSQQRKE